MKRTGIIISLQIVIENVRTHIGFNQNYRRTCHGISPASTSEPPTMRTSLSVAALKPSGPIT